MSFKPSARTWTTGDPLQKKVDVALDAAVFENGYVDLMSHRPVEVAVDLCTYVAGLEGEDLGEVEKRVADYQAWYRDHGP